MNAFGDKKFRKAGSFVEWVARVQGKGDSTWYYINISGENAFGDKTFINAEPFSEGVAAVEGEDGSQYYINIKGR